nr:uncharacterized protein LOC114824173 [Malus domestica]
MKDDKSLSAYLTKLFDLINQMRSYGEELSRERIVQKMLISLPSVYDPICSVIEHSRDIDVIEVQEVVASLKSFARRLERHSENKTEKAFARHIARDCNNKKNVQQLNYATQVPTMFYVNNAINKKPMEDVWYVDSGCSNHMTGREDVLVDVDRSITVKVEMGTGQLVDVVGKGSLVVNTKMGRRTDDGAWIYFLIFGDNKVEIYDDCSLSTLIAKVQMKGNRSFPLKLQTGLQFALRASVGQSTLIWHRRMGHFNLNSLKLLQGERDGVWTAGNKKTSMK